MSTPNPITVSVAADKAQYNVGDPITATVTYTDSATGLPVTVPLVITADVTDSAGNSASGTVTVDVVTGAAPPPTMSVTVTDSFSDAYTPGASSPGSAQFTSTVGTPPAAAPSA
jgi:hypothetical protein